MQFETALYKTQKRLSEILKTKSFNLDGLAIPLNSETLTVLGTYVEYYLKDLLNVSGYQGQCGADMVYKGKEYEIKVRRGTEEIRCRDYNRLDTTVILFSYNLSTADVEVYVASTVKKDWKNWDQDPNKEKKQPYRIGKTKLMQLNKKQKQFVA